MPWPSHTRVEPSVQQAGRRLRACPVPLEYSLGWLTCAIADRLDTVIVGWAGDAQDRLRTDLPILGLIVVLSRGDQTAAAEVLVLRHENAVLRSHAGRVR
jgi:hypothetical protein